MVRGVEIEGAAVVLAFANPDVATKRFVAANDNGPREPVKTVTVRKQLENLGLQMPPKDKLAPEALGAWQKAEIAKWWPMIKAANVKVD